MDGVWREIAIGKAGSLLLDIRPFGAPLPGAAGVYVLFLPPRSPAERARGHGAIWHAGQSDDLDEAVGRGREGHGRYWSFVAAGVAEIGIVVMEEPGERQFLLRLIAEEHRLTVGVGVGGGIG